LVQAALVELPQEAAVVLQLNSALSTRRAVVVAVRPQPRRQVLMAVRLAAVRTTAAPVALALMIGVTTAVIILQVMDRLVAVVLARQAKTASPRLWAAQAALAFHPPSLVPQYSAAAVAAVAESHQVDREVTGVAVTAAQTFRTALLGLPTRVAVAAAEEITSDPAVTAAPVL